METKTSLIIIVLLTTILGCSTKPEEKSFKKKNETSYTFNVSKYKLKSILISGSDIFFFEKNMALSYKNGKLKPLDTLDIFDQPGNRDDFYLRFQDFVVLKSHIYSMNGVPLTYKVSFHLHLDLIDSTHTRIVINTIKPKIIIGKELSPKGLHFSRNNEYLNVQPSTIEEYEILLQVGRLVGEKEMPPIQYP